MDNFSNIINGIFSTEEHPPTIFLAPLGFILGAEIAESVAQNHLRGTSKALQF